MMKTIDLKVYKVKYQNQASKKRRKMVFLQPILIKPTKNILLKYANLADLKSTL